MKTDRSTGTTPRRGVSPLLGAGLAALAGAALIAAGLAAAAPALGVAGGLLAGAALAGGAVVLLMPRLMIVCRDSPLGFDETVALLEGAIVEHGWVHQGTNDLQANLRRRGIDLPQRVKNIDLCHPRYAKDVLASDRHMACLMPCSLAVFDGDGGKVRIAKMNTRLMGKLFGGNVARVMGGAVADDEEAILAHLDGNPRGEAA